MRASKKTKTYHHKDLRLALIDEALKTLAMDGVSQLSLRDLARKLGVSHSAPLRHFRSKNDLLADLATQGFRMLTGAMQEAAAPHVGTAAVKALQCAGIAYVMFASRNSQLFRLMFAVDRIDSTRYPDLLKSGEAAKAALLTLVQAGIDGGELSDRPATALVLSCWALVHGIATLAIDHQLDTGAEAELNAVTACVLDLLQRGIGL